MNVFFDNCTALPFAATLNGFISHEGHAAYHIKDVQGLSKGRHSADVEWITYLRDSPDVWIFITGDARVLKNPAERAALRSAGLHGFILARSFQKTQLNQCAATLVWRWPDIVKVTQLLEAPSMHEIPIGRNTKLRQIPV